MIPRPSPHHSPRQPNRPITLIVLHADAGGSEQGTLAHLANPYPNDPAKRVSYHVLIGRTGTAYRVVDDTRTAWHAGVSSHPACRNPRSVNSESLGLSFANRHDGRELLTDAQIAKGREVVALWRAAHPTIVEVTTHARVAPGRKTDPEAIPNFRLEDYQ